MVAFSKDEDKVMADLLKAKQDGLGVHFSPEMVKEALESYFFDDFTRQASRVRDLCVLFETQPDMDMTFIQAVVDGFSAAVKQVVDCHTTFMTEYNKGDK